jgi:hypothetical protein
MKKILLVDGFYSKNDLFEISNVSKTLKYHESEFGEEILDFNLIIDNSDKIFSDFLDGKYKVDRENSGVFRKPTLNIHYEHHETIDDWRFFTALEQTTFNLFKHKSGAVSSLENKNLNFNDFTEWDYVTNILLEPNQGLFFRPWLFHSIQGGTIQYYNIKPI